MVRPKAPSFGELDWEIESDPSGARPAPPAPEAPFGEITVDLDSDPEIGREHPDGRGGAAPSERAIKTVPSAGLDAAALEATREPRGDATSSGVATRIATDAQGHGGAIAALRDLYARGEAAAALAVASELRDTLGAPETPRVPAAPAASDAADHTVAANERASSLPAMISSEGVPRLLMPPREVAQLALDHRAGFLLAHIDGMHSMEEILDVCAMPEAEALAILERLCALGVIAL